MINRVVLVGRLTRDVDLRYTQSGVAVASFTLAVDRNYTNQAGSRDADFISCVIWRKSAETLANYAHKGSLIGLEGRLQSRSYENQQGQRVYVTEVIVDNFSLLESRAVSQQRNGGINNQTPVNNQYGAMNNQNFGAPNNQSSVPSNATFNNAASTADNMATPNATNSMADPYEDSAAGRDIDISDDDLPF